MQVLKPHGCCFICIVFLYCRDVFSVTIVLGQTAPVHFHHINNSQQLLKNKGGLLHI